MSEEAEAELLGLMQAEARYQGAARMDGREGDVRERCKSLAGFVREAWHVLEPHAVYIHNWHIDAICALLEQVTAGGITRLRINVPPGFSKSILVSVFWPAWEWAMGRRSLRYLATAFNEDPVKRDTRKMRDLILSPWFQSLWPEVHLVRTAEMSFANTETGTREAVPFGSLTSQRGDRLILDDPNNANEGDLDRTSTARRFRESAVNRLNDQARSAIVVIQQRLHEDDVSGTIERMGMEYVDLILPMEFEPERRCRIEIAGEVIFEDPRTYDGELLDPIRFPRDVVDKLKRDMGSFAFAGQYQQRPSPREGGMFKIGMIERVERLPRAIKAVRAWDFAASVPKPGSDPDYTAGLKLIRDEAGVFYVTDVKRARITGAEVERLVLATARADTGETRIRYPKDPGQAGVAQAAAYSRILAGYSFTCLPVTGSKVTRAGPAAAQVEAGNVKMLVGEWNDAFLAELAVFPGGRHDDAVDCFSDAIAEISETTGAEGLMEFYRQEAEKVTRPAPRPEDAEKTLMQAPAGTGSVYGIRGHRYQRRADGLYEIEPEDVAPLSRRGFKAVQFAA